MSAEKQRREGVAPRIGAADGLDHENLRGEGKKAKPEPGQEGRGQDRARGPSSLSTALGQSERGHYGHMYGAPAEAATANIAKAITSRTTRLRVLVIQHLPLLCA